MQDIIENYRNEEKNGILNKKVSFSKGMLISTPIILGVMMLGIVFWNHVEQNPNINFIKQQYIQKIKNILNSTIRVYFPNKLLKIDKEEKITSTLAEKRKPKHILSKKNQTKRPEFFERKAKQTNIKKPENN